MLRLENNALELLLHGPLDGSYCGTRFDRSGNFAGVRWKGTELAGHWFPHYDPYAHDAVCGPAEEFSAIGFDDAAPGGTFLKPGVGILVRPDSEPYDRFRLYELADGGEWECESSGQEIVFRHILREVYSYSKRIVLTGPDSFEISHRLESHLPLPLSGEVYNHNFWTFGGAPVGPSRLIDFPFRPAGTWRTEYDSVAFTPSGIRFFRPLAEGESVYASGIHASGSEGMLYSMSISDGGIRIAISGSVPVSRTILWANPRVACLEPYNDFKTPFSWTIRYGFSQESN